jgi:26S proteasome regulatory subunit N12
LHAGDILEHAVVLSVKMEDQDAFERHFLQLKSYYTDTRGLVPPSEQEYPILGLNLLRLLVQNRIAEFHTGARTSLLPVFVLITIFCIVMTSYNYRVLRFTDNAVS